MNALHMRRLLILSCSKRKRRDAGLLPAVERYDGPPFRVLRKFLRESPGGARDLDILVLSAEFGLIPADRAIPLYDRRMSAGQASRLSGQASAGLREQYAAAHHRSALVMAGRDYLSCLDRPRGTLRQLPDVCVSTGTPGQRLSQLRDWLHSGLLAPETRPT